MKKSPSETVHASIENFDIFVDLSYGSDVDVVEIIRRLRHTKTVGRITCVSNSAIDPSVNSEDGAVRVHSASASIQALAAAIELARYPQRHLLVLLGGIEDIDIIDQMANALNADPMIGFVQPRFSNNDKAGIVPLPLAQERLEFYYSTEIIRHLPQIQLTPELVAACVLIRGQLLANFPDTEQKWTTSAAALLALMTWSRHRGYRVAIANHAVAVIPTSCEAYPSQSPEEQARLLEQYPDLAKAEARFRALPCHRREALLAVALSPNPTERRRVLLDCRGMQRGFNGTTECILGLLNGLHSSGTKWSVTALVSTEAASYHRLEERYPQFKIICGLPNEMYTVAIRLSQPWSFQDLIDLHESALMVAVNMLDTIAWDIVAAESNVEDIWSFVAKYFSGLMFISEFTRDRFDFRFPIAEGVREAVTYLSFHHDDYATDKVHSGPDKKYSLIVGNHFDHKGISQAVDLLANAFPYEHFIVIGPANTTKENVEFIASGGISQEKVDELFAGAKMLIYPSFYEGFGFPIVKGLSCGLDVVARRSTLLSEIATHCGPRGRVLPFDDPQSLVVVVGKILAKEPLDVLALGAAIEDGTEPLNWRDIAVRMMDFVEVLAGEISGRQYDERDSALRLRLIKPN